MCTFRLETLSDLHRRWPNKGSVDDFSGRKMLLEIRSLFVIIETRRWGSALKAWLKWEALIGLPSFAWTKHHPADCVGRLPRVAGYLITYSRLVCFGASSTLALICLDVSGDKAQNETTYAIQVATECGCHVPSFFAADPSLSQQPSTLALHSNSRRKRLLSHHSDGNTDIATFTSRSLSFSKPSSPPVLSSYLVNRR